MACIADADFPYPTNCTSLKKANTACNDDYECEANTLCWYPSRHDFYYGNKTCMMKYNLASNSTFGWAPKYYDTVKDLLYNGQFCKSGIAMPLNDLNTSLTLIQNISGFYDNRPQGLCVDIVSVRTDLGLYTDFQNDVPECVSQDLGSYCQYHYHYEKILTRSIKTRCACAADGSIGYCPIPNGK